MIDLVVKPGVVAHRAEFLATHPPYSIALDGYVFGEPFLVTEERGPYRNFNHHEAVDRSCTCATCEQARRAVLLGLYDLFRTSRGPEALLYVNDCDQDVCLSTWILMNPDRAHEPLVRTITQIEDLLDMSAGSFPMPHERDLLGEIRWVFDPYARARPQLASLGADAMKQVIVDVHMRIEQFVMGRAVSKPLEGTYQRLGGGDGWAIVEVDSQSAREKMIAAGIRAAIEVYGRHGGRWLYSIWRRSEYIVKFPVREILRALNRAEGHAPDDVNGWGGAENVGGSPRGRGSKLAPADVERVVAAVLAGNSMKRLVSICAALAACGGAHSTAVRPIAVQLDAGPSSGFPRTTTAAFCQAAPPKGPADAGVPDADDGDGDGGDDSRMLRGRVDKPDDPKDTCAVADSNIARVEDAILAAKPTTAAAPIAAKPWDHKTPPRSWSEIARRYALSAGELAALTKNGFVVPAKLAFDSYSWALHDVYESQVPIYISADAIFHAVFAANDSLIAGVERDRLAPLVGEALRQMQCALPATAAGWPRDVARDVDVYLTVARSLLQDGDKPQPLVSMFGAVDPTIDTQVAELFADAEAGTDMKAVDLFGRQRMVDFTQFTPRGHYDGTDLAPYFRAATWLSRIEFNLVSRSSRSSEPGDAPNPEETPREELDALALLALADAAGATPSIQTVDDAWTLLAGRREDVSFRDLTAVRAKAKIASLTDAGAPARLRAAIGDGFQRKARTHYMPEGSTVLPAIATILGPRIAGDTQATRPLVDGEIPGRYLVGAADMAYALGQDRAKAYLADDLAKFGGLAAGLDKARTLVSAPASDDLYGRWLTAIRALAAPTDGQKPSFMASEAFADLRVGTAVAAFGQLRHNNVLMEAGSYDEGGCEIPDGYVDPALPTWDALIAYADLGAARVGAIDPGDNDSVAYFQRLGRIVRILRAISVDELAGRALTDDEKAFLSMVVEMTPGSTGGPPTFTGWWFDLFQDRQGDGLRSAHFIADYYTSTNADRIAYVGADGPHLGVFVVDVNGPPRLVVGPVADAWETTAPLDKRLTDTDPVADADKRAPWARSYTVAAPPAPLFSLDGEPDYADENEPKKRLQDVIDIDAPAALGEVTVELLDHNFRPIASMTKKVGAGKTKLAFPPRRGASYEKVHVRIGAWNGWGETTEGCGCVGIDTTPRDQN